MQTAAVIVLAKAPAPGRVKTRLVPPLDHEAAAALAAAALEDTLDAVGAARVPRRFLVLDGDPRGWTRPDLTHVAQHGPTFADRLAHAFADVDEPAVLIGMDTPQVTSAQIEHACWQLMRPSVDAVLGESPDGGWWALGLRRPDARVFQHVPMSTQHTGAAQHRRLVGLGYRVRRLPALLDVDLIADAHAVARHAPTGRFAAALRRVAPPGGDVAGGWPRPPRALRG